MAELEQRVTLLTAQIRYAPLNLVEGILPPGEGEAKEAENAPFARIAAATSYALTGAGAVVPFSIHTGTVTQCSEPHATNGMCEDVMAGDDSIQDDP